MSVSNALKAIKSKLEGMTSTPHVASVWFGPAPDGTTGTFATLSIPDSQPGQSMGTSPAYWEDVVVTIDIWDDSMSPNGCIAVLESVKSLFQGASPLGSSVACSSATRTSYAILPDPEGGYHASADYVFTMEE